MIMHTTWYQYNIQMRGVLVFWLNIYLMAYFKYNVYIHRKQILLTQNHLLQSLKVNPIVWILTMILIVKRKILWNTHDSKVEFSRQLHFKERVAIYVESHSEDNAVSTVVCVELLICEV